jgi:hypothetical protein
MPYSNLTFQVQPNLELKPFDFVQINGTDLTTSTTTSTTTSGIISLYVAANITNSCTGVSGISLPTYLYTGTPTLCGCTSLNAANATSLSAGFYYVSDGTNTAFFQSTGGGSTLLTRIGSCVAC